MTYDEPKIIVLVFNEASGFYTTKKRSKIMSNIRGKNTKAELLFRRALWKKNIRYRVVAKNSQENRISPSKKYNLAIFIDGEIDYKKDETYTLKLIIISGAEWEIQIGK